MVQLYFFVMCFFIVGIAHADLKNISFKEDCRFTQRTKREWCLTRQQRYKNIQKYHREHQEGSQALLVNANGVGQVPYIFFRLFAELFPEIWGGDIEPFDRIGLTKNPFSTDPSLPLGIASGPAKEKLSAWNDQTYPINKVTFSCVACHSGEVNLNSNQRLKMIGAPSTRINNLWFAFARTAKLNNFEAEVFRKAITDKPKGWFYKDQKAIGVEARELELLLKPNALEEIVKKFKNSATLQLTAFNYFANYNYLRNPDMINPAETRRGSLDGLIPSFLAFLRENMVRVDLQLNAFPKVAAEVDSASIWMQKGKGFKHWDGTQGVDLHRNVGAARANLNDPVDIANVAKVTEFINELPADPYPFNINMASARRGERLFVSYCLNCHGSRNQVIDINRVGTDPNRVSHFPPIMADFQGKILKTLCTDSSLCSKPDGSAFQTHELSREAKGYVAGSLEGLWARAPYLHNGSVPNLRALLTKERPTRFYRGNINYDQKNIGFSSDYPSTGAILYDTSRSGNSNAGHDTIEFLGKDWGRNANELEDLLEYLKTL